MTILFSFHSQSRALVHILLFCVKLLDGAFILLTHVNRDFLHIQTLDFEIFSEGQLFPEVFAFITSVPDTDNNE